MNDINKLSKNRHGTGDIRLRIKVTANQSFRLFYQIATKEGGFVSVDWGDGNKETFTSATEYSPEHLYDKAGEYIVKLTGSKFTGVIGNDFPDSYTDFQNAVREILSLKMPTDSTGVSLRNAFYRCTNLTGSIPTWDNCITNASYTYFYCTGLTGNIPAWGAKITSAYGTYHSCSGLTGKIPEWGMNITNTSYTYYGCIGLTGGIPSWGTNITSAYGTYKGCTGLTGNIPKWGVKITDADSTYYGCKGLTGNIPTWGEKITDASQTYQGCTGLTGCSEELLQDPMPSRITFHGNCVFGCVSSVRQHFMSDWGGNKAKLTESMEKFKDVYEDLAATN